MTVSISFLNALCRIPCDVEVEIRSGINDGIAALCHHTSVENVGIAVHPSIFVARETGFGGMAFGPENCGIYVDPANRHLFSETREKAASMTIHEVHHVLRMKHLNIQKAEDWSAGQVLVLEGLATQAEIFLGCSEPMTVRDITYSDIAPLLENIGAIVGNSDADWDWINQPSGLPDSVYRAAYPMGHYLVGRYLELTGKDPIQTIATPWQEVWSITMK